MSKVLFANNAVTTLLTDVDSTTTTISLTPGTGGRFPSPSGGDYFIATIQSGAVFEIVRVTSRSVDSVTVVRGQEGTPASPFPAGASFEVRVTAGGLSAFAQAPDLASVVPPGVIWMWSGSIQTIPSGWALCDGTNGTPNLRDRFIVGAGSSYGVGATGGQNTATTSSAGAHTHGGATDGHALTEAQMPAHTHTGTTGSAGEHTHGMGGSWGNDTSQGTANINNFGGGTIGIRSTTDAAGSHTHSVSVSSTGGGQAHSHNITSDGAHTHTVDTRSPYFALAFIMKL